MKHINVKYYIITISLIFSFLSCQNSQESNTPNPTETQDTEATLSGPRLVKEEVIYSSGDLEMHGYISYDSDIEGMRPGVIVVHEWWGHNDYARLRADMLAELGYVVMALDMYGEGKIAEHPSDAGSFAGAVMSDIDVAKARFQAAMDLLMEHPKVDPEHIAAIGYCFGGSVVLSMANLGFDLDAVAAFHSGVQLPVQPSADGIKAKILVCNGADDPMITEEQVNAYKESLDAVNADYIYISFPGVKHAFTNPDATEMGDKFDLPLEYNEEADNVSWEELTVFLQASL